MRASHHALRYAMAHARSRMRCHAILLLARLPDIYTLALPEISYSMP